MNPEKAAALTSAKDYFFVMTEGTSHHLHLTISINVMTNTNISCRNCCTFLQNITYCKLWYRVFDTYMHASAILGPGAGTNTGKGPDAVLIGREGGTYSSIVSSSASSAT
jgi:hypothetical protein